MKFIMSTLALLTLTACQSTGSASHSEYAGLALTEGEMTKAKWKQLVRKEPRYPIAEAKARRSGCATLEYVVTPDYQITEIEVVDASRSKFAKSARQSIADWQWQQVPAGNLEQPIKTQTRFEFCVEEVKGECSEARLLANTQCRGEDMVSAVGTLIKI
ncbi:energy transducer TonB [Shewanella corallii]|uniref:Energy transducer TonB n=1 Tax=Shewanella corallii TaxID=560080 RepID=A0ABT0N474_9GAMM|nr:energy transducer TonB [Shewanella corallii]MCL2913234.1 energy transducer TonB [Shewanella corallii]